MPIQMINVAEKPITYRFAVASGVIKLSAHAFSLLEQRQLPKGDALLLAEVAGINGAKNTSQLIPLCHPLVLDCVNIRSELNAEEHSVKIYCVASAHARTGVEMEALAGVHAALLTIWDLTKMIEPNLQIDQVYLLAKVGGKSGVWSNPRGVPAWVDALLAPYQNTQVLSRQKIAVLTISDRAALNVYSDESGTQLTHLLSRYGAEISAYQIVPDEIDAVRQQIEVFLQDAPALILCTGGTGVAPRDITPEALRPLFAREIPGIGELLRQAGAHYTPCSWASRSIAGVIGSTLVIALPGNPKAVQQALAMLLPCLLPHLLYLLAQTPQ